jgi:hypothetical protein
VIIRTYHSHVHSGAQSADAAIYAQKHFDTFMVHERTEQTGFSNKRSPIFIAKPPVQSNNWVADALLEVPHRIEGIS